LGVITQRTCRHYIGADADKASIPAAAKTAGDIFEAIDTGYFYVWSGAAWVWTVPDASIVEAKIGPLACTNGKIGPAAIDASKIDTNAVETSRIKAANVTRPKLAPGVGTWDIVHDTILGAPAASVVIGSLAGNTAEVYLLLGRFVSTVNSSIPIARFNADAGNNYNLSSHGFGTAHQFGQTNAIAYARLSGPADIGIATSFKALIYARAGFSRDMLAESISVGYGNHYYTRWTNTADELISITVSELAANNLGAGTHITLLKKSQVST